MTTATAIKERPILFSAEMVRAILDDRKTQTRRLYKGFFAGDLPAWPDSGKGSCPYGKPGDRLWVRESFGVIGKAGDWRLVYSADTSQLEIDDSEIDMGRLKPGKNYPSIHMPRWASRILLELTDVRVERLQAISDEDVIAEGIDPETNATWQAAEHYAAGGSPIRGGSCERCAYADLWEKINGPGSWDADPWVWVVSFKRVTP